MSDKPIEKIIESSYKDLTTKYNVLVKRTNSIITSVNTMNAKLDFLVEKMSMFELMEDENEDEEIEGYEPYDDDDEDDDDEGEEY